MSAEATDGKRPFDAPLLLVGARCAVRYFVLPFALPTLSVVFGATDVVTGAAFGILVILDALAVVSIATTLRRLWRIQHPRRRLYLVLALTLTALIAIFFVNDARVLL